MITLALLAAAQTMVTSAPPIAVARPATGWSCDFLDAAGASFLLKGQFAEAPVGTDPNADLPTLVEGNGPAFLLGRKGYNAFESSAEARRYQLVSGGPDGTRYNLSFLFLRNREGLAFITRYVPDPATGRGRLSSYATASCKASFLAPGAGASKP